MTAPDVEDLDGVGDRRRVVAAECLDLVGGRVTPADIDRSSPRSIDDEGGEFRSDLRGSQRPAPLIRAGAMVMLRRSRADAPSSPIGS